MFADIMRQSIYLLLFFHFLPPSCPISSCFVLSPPFPKSHLVFSLHPDNTSAICTKTVFTLAFPLR